MRNVSLLRLLAPLLLGAALAWPADPALAMCGGNVFATCAPARTTAQKLGRGSRAKPHSTRGAGRRRPG